MIAKLRVKGSTDSGYSEQHVLMLSCNYNIQRLLKSLYIMILVVSAAGYRRANYNRNRNSPRTSCCSWFRHCPLVTLHNNNMLAQLCIGPFTQQATWCKTPIKKVSNCAYKKQKLQLNSLEALFVTDTFTIYRAQWSSMAKSLCKNLLSWYDFYLSEPR